EMHFDGLSSMTQEILKFINSQRELKLNCKVLAGDTLLQLLSYNAHSLGSKVKYDHAENVLSVVMRELKENAYFAQYLGDILIPDSELSKVKPAFKPFLHGSNASTLA